MDNGPKLLIIDDDTEFIEFITEYLRLEGFIVDYCFDGETGITKATKNDYDLIIIDILLPTIDGLKVLRSLHSYLDTPIIMLTASGKEIDHIVGLELGADDYIDKPFNSKILVSRIKAVLRRHETTEKKAVQDNITDGKVELNYKRKLVLVGGEPLTLTRSEFKIFELFFKNIGQLFSKEDIAEKALARKLTKHDRSIDAHVLNLRLKLRKINNLGLILKTIHSFGYCLERNEN